VAPLFPFSLTGVNNSLCRNNAHILSSGRKFV